MGTKGQRQLSLGVGALILLLAASVAVLFDAGMLDDPSLFVQFGAMAVGGALHVLAGFDSPTTDRIGWHRLLGAANVFLGVSVLLGYLGTDAPVLLLLATFGGFALLVLGFDMLLFAGRHVYSEPLD